MNLSGIHIRSRKEPGALVWKRIMREKICDIHISGMEAVVSGMAMIQAGLVDTVLVGGMEHMSGIAYSVPTARWGCRDPDVR
jgi:hypothetical protein